AAPGTRRTPGARGMPGAAPGGAPGGVAVGPAAVGTRQDGMPRPLMLVSASLGARLREEVKGGERPCPEYLRLEQDYDVHLVEWAPGGPVRRRSLRAFEHTAAALGPVRQATAVLSDGEHAGIPLALAMLAARIRTPHVMIGHHLLTRSKLAAL